jgi:hypothetical protein
MLVATTATLCDSEGDTPATELKPLRLLGETDKAALVPAVTLANLIMLLSVAVELYEPDEVVRDVADDGSKSLVSLSM